MLLTYCAYMAVAVCLAGIVYRISRWLTLDVGPEAEAASIGDRLRGAGKALTGVLRHPRYLWRLIKAFLLDIVLQRHLLKQSAWRWGVHIALFFGMVLLLVVHTFPGLITARLFPEYASTLNPFMFFRNFLGILVMAGVFSALWRRWRNPVLRCTIQPTDIWLLILLGGIILSGAALEAAQIISPALFDQMVMDYMGSEDPDAVVPLKAYWAAEFDVAFGPHPSADDPALVEKGLALHLDYCADCHSKPSSAVLAYPLARVIKPFSALLDRIDAVTLLWYGHFLISCLALTLLPFSKLFHLLSTPLSLLIRAMGPVASSRRDNRPARRALGLDACTHCGVCSQHCAVAPIFSIIPNADILPSEKLRGVARMASGRNQPICQAALAEGSFICTDCGRCTFWCPSGIDLRDLWHASRGGSGSIWIPGSPWLDNTAFSFPMGPNIKKQAGCGRRATPPEATAGPAGRQSRHIPGLRAMLHLHQRLSGCGHQPQPSKGPGNDPSTGDEPDAFTAQGIRHGKPHGMGLRHLLQVPGTLSPGGSEWPIFYMNCATKPAAAWIRPWSGRAIRRLKKATGPIHTIRTSTVPRGPDQCPDCATFISPAAS